MSVIVSSHLPKDMQETPEQFSIKWNDFHESITASYRDLRNDNDFTDITLACGDGHQVEAHRNILSSCSPFFKAILKRAKHPHPIIYMRGMSEDDISSLLNFLYYGETKVLHQNLQQFLSLAKELQLKGLDQDDHDDRNQQTNSFEQPNVKNQETIIKQEVSNVLHENTNPKSSQNLTENKYSDLRNETVNQTAFITGELDNVIGIQETKENLTLVEENITLVEETKPKVKRKYTKRAFNTVAEPTKPKNKRKSWPRADMNQLPSYQVDPSITEEELDDKIDSMMTLGEGNQLVCTVCGMITREKSNMVNHIEGQHIEGILHPCNLCLRQFKCRAALKIHSQKDCLNN